MDDRGESLVEILVAVLILGITAAAVMTGLLTSVKISDVHRKQATAGAYARDYAESISRYVTAGSYAACAGTAGQPSYTSAFATVTLPAGYKTPVATYRYWDPTWTAGSATSPWVSTCSVGSDTGLQQVTVQLESSDGRAMEQSVVVVRKP
jgi:type II secretory pathway pseudopilin PulG